MTVHKFISRLVCYDSTGLTRIETTVDSLCKLAHGMIKEKKETRTSFLSVDGKGFVNDLEVEGFDVKEYGFFKYEKVVEICNMKLKEVYAMSALRAVEEKAKIEIDEYLKLKMDLLSGL